MVIILANPTVDQIRKHFQMAGYWIYDGLLTFTSLDTKRSIIRL